MTKDKSVDNSGDDSVHNDSETQAEIDNAAGRGNEPGNGNEAGNSENFESGLSLDEALSRLEQAETEAQQAQDDVLRVKAEMQNLRRRTEQDIEKAHKFGQERFVTELLSVVDNLERALEAAAGDSQDAAESDRIKAIFDGVDLTLKSFLTCFGKYNIEVIDPLGEPFDPLQHQAMSMQENSEVEPNTVIAVMQKGYKLHDRVIRPAMVMVSRGEARKIDETA